MWCMDCFVIIQVLDAFASHRIHLHSLLQSIYAVDCLTLLCTVLHHISREPMRQIDLCFWTERHLEMKMKGKLASETASGMPLAYSNTVYLRYWRRPCPAMPDPKLSDRARVLCAAALLSPTVSATLPDPTGLLRKYSEASTSSAFSCSWTLIFMPRHYIAFSVLITAVIAFTVPVAVICHR